MIMASGKLWLVHCCITLMLGLTSHLAIGSQSNDVNLPEDATVKSAPDVCKIYIFNISGWTLIPSNQELADNGKQLVSLPRQTYNKINIAPGVHELVLHGRKLVLNAEMGKIYYVVMGYKPERSWAFPIGGDPVFIRQISEEEARPLLQQLKTP